MRTSAGRRRRAALEAEAAGRAKPAASPARPQKALPQGPGGGAPAKAAGRGRQQPQLSAGRASMPPDGDDWMTEIKFDGYRLLIFVADGQARVC